MFIQAVVSRKRNAPARQAQHSVQPASHEPQSIHYRRLNDIRLQHRNGIWVTCSHPHLSEFCPAHHLFSDAPLFAGDRSINQWTLSLPLSFSLTPSTFIPINYIQQGSLLCAQPARPPPPLLDLIASFPDHEDADKITAVATPTHHRTLSPIDAECDRLA